jgi:DNA-binding NarL/FixJ family response regulator
MNDSVFAPVPLLKRQQEPAPVRVLILHDNTLFRDGLARLLTSQPRLELVAECGSIEEATEALRLSPVDVVITGFRGGPGTEELITFSRASGYTGRFLVLARSGEAASAATALRLGASGLFLESGSPDRLLLAIELIAAGDAWVDPTVVQLLAKNYSHMDCAHPAPLAVTDRQREVLQGVVDGLGNREIGVRLGVSESSIKGTLQQLFARTGVRTRSQLVRAVLEGPPRDPRL